MKLFGSRVELPPQRCVPWTLKDVSTAEIDFRFLDDGPLCIRIRHDILHGVSPKMLVWWFSNLEGDIQINDRVWPRYQIWHPIDHISIRYVRRRQNRTIGPGDRIHIREVLCGRCEYLIDMISTIEKLDESGFIHGPCYLGFRPCD